VTDGINILTLLILKKVKKRAKFSIKKKKRCKKKPIKRVQCSNAPPKDGSCGKLV